jgi:hypothetical protein
MPARPEQLRRKIDEMDQRYDSKFPAVLLTLRQRREPPCSQTAEWISSPNGTVESRQTETRAIVYSIEYKRVIYPQAPSFSLRKYPFSSKI